MAQTDCPDNIVKGDRFAAGNGHVKGKENKVRGESGVELRDGIAVHP